MGAHLQGYQLRLYQQLAASHLYTQLPFASTLPSTSWRSLPSTSASRKPSANLVQHVFSCYSTHCQPYALADWETPISGKVGKARDDHGLRHVLIQQKNLQLCGLAQTSVIGDEKCGFVL
jgi:hypothetical protein